MIDQRKESYSAREQLADIIRQKIRGGEFAPGSRLDSVRALTERHKFSHATAIRALEILEKEGYLVTRQRKGSYVSDKVVWRKTTRVVKVLTGMYAGAAWSPGDRGHLDGAKRIERRLVSSSKIVSFQGSICYPYLDARREYVPLKLLGTESADAVVALGIYDHAFLGSLQLLNKPVIVYDLDASMLRMDSACIDDVWSAFEMTNLLLGRGYRRIAFLAGRMNAISREEYWNYDPCVLRRVDGYIAAMRAAGLAENVVFSGKEESPSEVEARLAVLAPGCDAVLVQGLSSYPSASGTGRAVAGWTVKGADGTWPGFAVVAECDFSAMGDAVVDLLEQRLANPSDPVKRSVIRPVVRVVREDLVGVK